MFPEFLFFSLFFTFHSLLFSFLPFVTIRVLFRAQANDSQNARPQETELISSLMKFARSIALVAGFSTLVKVAEAEPCRARQVMDTCMDLLPKLRQPLKTGAQIMAAGMYSVEFKPTDDVKKVALESWKDPEQELWTKKVKLDHGYTALPTFTGPLMMACANEREVFPNACSGIFGLDVFWTKTALRHARALGDGDLPTPDDTNEDPAFPDMPIVDPEAGLIDLRNKLKELFENDQLDEGVGFYIFSEYDEEEKKSKDVMKAIFSLGKDAGICEKEYKVISGDCFGMKNVSRPPLDPPKLPSLSDTVQPALPELKAKLKPMEPPTEPPTTGPPTTAKPSDGGDTAGGGSAATIIAIVVVVLLLLGAGGFFVHRQRRIEAERNSIAREVELR